MSLTLSSSNGIVMQKGQQVKLSDHGMLMVAHRFTEHAVGKITSVRGSFINVKVEGFKNSITFHNSYWEEDDGLHIRNSGSIGKRSGTKKTRSKVSKVEDSKETIHKRDGSGADQF